jgi:hypothetical protein
VPDVPVALSVPRWTQPLIVTLRDDELCDVRELCDPDVCDDELVVDDGFCAITTAASPTVKAAHVPDQIRAVIVPP